MKGETYGCYLTPHFEKYQNQDIKTAEIMHDTWNFGNALKGKGYSVCYMMGPVALYEGSYLDAITFEFKTEDHVTEFLQEQPLISKKDEEGRSLYVFFLYQKLKDKVRFQYLQKNYIKEMRKTRTNESN